MHVVATAGHVDHGKSTLVRALTGRDPDRLAEEHRRGMTIELGYAWADLPEGRVAFVDVPGHERFLGTMLAGVGPVPAVLLVVAADEGWRRQTGEHVAALQALGVEHLLLAVTRSDLADPAPAAADALRRVGRDVPWVGVSAVTGQGLAELRTALGRLVAGLPKPVTDGRVRLFVDRVFSSKGSGTVVTGTLQSGTLRIGDHLDVGGRDVVVRALQETEEPRDEVRAVARVAVNLRGVPAGVVERGAALLTPGAWLRTSTVDVALAVVDADAALPRQLVLHVGSASVPVDVRVLGTHHARLTLLHPLPLTPGDRGVLRDPGRHAVAAGVHVVDADPPSLAGRGLATARTRLLGGGLTGADVLRAAGAMTAPAMQLRGWAPVGLQHGDWRVDPATWAGWGAAIREMVEADLRSGSVGPPLATVAGLLPDPALVDPLLDELGLAVRAGRVVDPAATPVHPGFEAVRAKLAQHPFAAPDADDLVTWGLDRRAVATLAAAGLVLRLPGEVVLLPDAPARAVVVLAGVAAPFTLAAAKNALGTSRRVAVPLLEHLDALGLTRRTSTSERVLS